MLKSIRKYDKKTREGLLAELVLSIGRPSLDTNPSDDIADQTWPRSIIETIESLVELNDNSEIYREILKEIAETLRLDQQDSICSGKTKILEFLGRQIRDLAVDSKDIAPTRKRLGQRGILASEGYKIKFTPDFQRLCETMGVARADVANAIRTPNMYEHYLPEIAERQSLEAISLYAKSQENAKCPYTLLIDTRRVGDEIFVHYAILIFHDEIDVSGISKPTELLEKFTNKFGREFSIGDLHRKLFLYTPIPLGRRGFFINFRNDRSTDIRASERMLADGNFEIVIAYGIDVEKYSSYLRRHGVRITRNLNKSPGLY